MDWRRGPQPRQSPAQPLGTLARHLCCFRYFYPAWRVCTPETASAYRHGSALAEQQHCGTRAQRPAWQGTQRPAPPQRATERAVRHREPRRRHCRSPSTPAVVRGPWRREMCGVFSSAALSRGHSRMEWPWSGVTLVQVPRASSDLRLEIANLPRLRKREPWRHRNPQLLRAPFSLVFARHPSPGHRAAADAFDRGKRPQDGWHAISLEPVTRDRHTVPLVATHT